MVDVQTPIRRPRGRRRAPRSALWPRFVFSSGTCPPRRPAPTRAALQTLGLIRQPTRPPLRAPPLDRRAGRRDRALSADPFCRSWRNDLLRDRRAAVGAPKPHLSTLVKVWHLPGGGAPQTPLEPLSSTSPLDAPRWNGNTQRVRLDGGHQISSCDMRRGRTSPSTAARWPSASQPYRADADGVTRVLNSAWIERLRSPATERLVSGLEDPHAISLYAQHLPRTARPLIMKNPNR